MYTSYFAKLNSLPKFVVPISICSVTPKFYKGLEYKKLAPSYKLLMDWKRNKDDELYVLRYREEVLNLLDPREVVKDLLVMSQNYKGINYMPETCLICYEKPTDFCHRHIVSEWLNNNGCPCREYTFYNLC